MEEILGLDEEKLDGHRDLMRRNLGPKWHDRDGDAIKTSSCGRLDITMANGSWSGSPHTSLLAARQPTAGVELSFSSSDQMAIQMKQMLIKHHIWVNYLIFRQNPFYNLQSGFADCLFTRHWEVLANLASAGQHPKNTWERILMSSRTFLTKKNEQFRLNVNGHNTMWPPPSYKLVYKPQ